jgi:hypothetical protein
MTPVDDLKEGQWITVVGNRHLDAQDDDDDSGAPFNPFDFTRPSRRQKPSYSGAPVKIVAISLPFIAVADGRGVDTLDMRVWQVKKVTKKYALTVARARKAQNQPHLMQPGVSHQSDSNLLAKAAGGIVLPMQSLVPELEKSEPIKHANLCPVCQHPLITRLKEGEREWKLECDECGFSGGRPGMGMPNDE